MIDPSLHLESVAAQPADPECCGPAVVDEQAQWNLDPLAGAFPMREQRGGDGVVAVGEDVGFNADQIAHGAFCGESASVHFGGDSFNDDAPASIRWSHCHDRSMLPGCKGRSESSPL